MTESASTFIVRFVRTDGDAFRGKVRHVPSGEEAIFYSAEELLAFFERVCVLSRVGSAGGEAADAPPRRQSASRRRRGTRKRPGAGSPP